MEPQSIITLAQSLDTGSNLATVIVLAWLAYKVSHLDKTISATASTTQRLARRLAYLFGWLALDEEEADNGEETENDRFN